MSLDARLIVACNLVLLGAIALLFLGGQFGMCLGPLGVTPVQCAQATGVVPDVGIGPPVFALTIAVATFVVAPPPVGRGLPVVLGGILGGAIGGTAFLVLRPRTMEGVDSGGTWISVARPLDACALATAVVFGALLGTILARPLPGVRRPGPARS